MDLRNPISVARARRLFAPRVQDVACLAADAVGDLICIRGNRINGKWRVQRADPYDLARMPAVGVLLSKTTPTVGVALLLGAAQLWGNLFHPGAVCFVGADGRPRHGPPPVGPGGWALVQAIGTAAAEDTLLLACGCGMIRRRG